MFGWYVIHSIGFDASGGCSLIAIFTFFPFDGHFEHCASVVRMLVENAKMRFAFIFQIVYCSDATLSLVCVCLF